MSTFMNIDAARLDRATATSGRADAQNKPDAADIAAFDRAVQNRQEGGEKQGEGDQEAFGSNTAASEAGGAKNRGRAEDTQANARRDSASESTEQASPGSLGPLGMTSPLDSLFGQRVPSVDGPAVTAPAEAPTPNALADKLVERILVAQPEQGGNEVRISLSQGVLPETEIRLQRGVDGQLTVTLLSDNPSSFQTLVAAQDSLRQRLERQESAGVQVGVASQTEQENNDSRRRSRGYQQEDYEN